MKQKDKIDFLVELLSKFDFIELPKKLKPLKYKSRKVLTEDLNKQNKQLSQKERLKELFKEANENNVFSLIEEPVKWQKELRNEWQ